MSYIKNVCFTILAILLFADVVWCRWCSRMTSEEHVHTITEASRCQKSYQESCDWFSLKMCTFYEMVTCYKEYNQTVVQYKAVYECCPGYELDTADNVTCLKQPDRSFPWKTTPLKDRNNTVQFYKSEDELLFGLSHGAYAGIICAFLFVSSVLSLILVHIIKRRQKAAAAKAEAGMENEMTEKILQAPQA